MKKMFIIMVSCLSLFAVNQPAYSQDGNNSAATTNMADDDGDDDNGKWGLLGLLGLLGLAGLKRRNDHDHTARTTTRTDRSI